MGRIELGAPRASGLGRTSQTVQQQHTGGTGGCERRCVSCVRGERSDSSGTVAERMHEAEERIVSQPGTSLPTIAPHEDTIVVGL